MRSSRMPFTATPFTVRRRDRTILEQWLRCPTTPQDLAMRARILLLRADGQGVRAVARRLGVIPASVCLWQARYKEDGVAGLRTRARSGRPKRITAAKERSVIAKTLTQPKATTHWSARRLAKETAISHSSVHRLWRKHDLQPHRTTTFKFSTDPDFESKMADVVGLYLDPPERALVLSVDEKSQIQALDRTQPTLPMGPGLPARMTHDYTRHGTTSLFAALEVASGKVHGMCFPKHTHAEFLDFLVSIDRKYRRTEIHLICDNYGTHKHPLVKAWLKEHPRFHMHFTPTSASWLNLVERWFAMITEQAIRRGSFNSVRALERAINKFLAHWNTDAKPFRWTKSARTISRQIDRVIDTYDTGH